MMRILVVGGTGYLGRHLLAALSSSSAYHTAFTHHRPTPPPDLLAAVFPALALRVDLQTGDGFDAISHAFGQPDVVINCAAISAPRACETDPEAAMGTNVPSSLVNWLARLDRGGGGEPLLIHLSTDQVYEGVKSFYKEEDETVPVNTYGKSKVVAEQFISSKCSNYAILRSSIIYGPQTISPVSKSLPIQESKMLRKVMQHQRKYVIRKHGQSSKNIQMKGRKLEGRESVKNPSYQDHLSS